jgi:hypothetical protein
MVNDNNTNRKRIAGADEVYPLIVYALLKSNVMKLKSNLNYIKTFRHESRMESSDEYYFTTVYTAVGFIEDINYKQLNITKDDFIRLCAEGEERELERMKMPKTVFKSIQIIYLGNNDENCLVYFLSEKQNTNTDYLEINDVKEHILNNTSSVINKSLLYNNDSSKYPLLKVDLESLYKEYFSSEFVDFTINKLEKLFNDFKLILRLIDSFIKAFKEKRATADNTNTTPKNLKKIHTEGNSNVNLIDL